MGQRITDFFLFCLVNFYYVQIFDCVLTWLRHDWTNRKEDMKGVFKKVRLGLIPIEYLRKKLTEFEDMPECQKLIQSVIDFKEDVKDQHPLALARECPSVCATRTTVSVSL